MSQVEQNKSGNMNLKKILKKKHIHIMNTIKNNYKNTINHIMKIIKNTLNKQQTHTKKNIKNGSLNMIDYTD